MNSDEESVIGFEALLESGDKCKCGVIKKSSVQRYVLNQIDETLKLEEQLKNGTYKGRKPRVVKITYPKERTALGNAFRDRVYQRSLNDNVLYPQITKSFIHANMACQKCKGTDKARKHFYEMLKRHFRLYGTKGGILQCDVEHFYDNMKHDCTKEKFGRNTPVWALERSETILNQQYLGDTGYNPGSQMVQIAGIAYLDDLDHFIKEKLHIEEFVRYMDDMNIGHPDMKYLEYCRDQIEIELQKIGLHLHPKKTKIMKITDKIRFLGFDFRLTKSGKVIMTIDPDNVKHERKKLARAVAKAKRGEIPKYKVHEMFKSWKAHARKGNSVNLIRNMNEYYKDLWRQ